MNILYIPGLNSSLNEEKRIILERYGKVEAPAIDYDNNPDSIMWLQQPLPGSLWAIWAFIETGTLTIQGNNKLTSYRNVCDREPDRLHFSSDHKMTLRWYDESYMIHEYFIGRYKVAGKILTVDLAKSRRYKDSLFPPITKYRIMLINSTTLHLEEIPNGTRSIRDRAIAGQEPLVFVFRKLD